MGQIEVLYDLGEPYVRLEDYRAVQARAATLTAEVERLTAERDALRAQLAEAEAATRHWYAEIVALRDQLEAGYRPVGEPESWSDGRIEIRPIGTPIFARVGFFLDSPDGIIVVEDDEVGDFICYWRTGSGFEWRPAPPQE